MSSQSHDKKMKPHGIDNKSHTTSFHNAGNWTGLDLINELVPPEEIGAPTRDIGLLMEVGR